MAETDTESITTTTTAPPISESDTSTTLSTTETKQSDNDPTPNPNPGTISLRIWPPTQKTRDAVIKRLIETLSTESTLTKRFGTLEPEEASSIAKSIEDEAYAVASAAVVNDDDGIEILKVYSKEISKRMLESVKAKTPSSVTSPTPKTGGDEETELADELGSVKVEDEA